MGSLSLKKQNFSSVTVAGTSPAYIFAGGETALTQLQNGITYKFFGGSNNTIGTFLNTNELTRSMSSANSDRLTVQQGGFTVSYYGYSDNTWRTIGNSSDQSSVIITEGASITFNTWDGAAKNVTVQGTNYVAIINNLNTFFNKDNFRKGTIAADSDVVQTINAVGATHNFFVRASDNTWRRNGSSFDQGSTVAINRNQKIVFVSYDESPIVINMIGNSFLQKNIQGKTNIKKQNQTILKPNQIISPSTTYGNQYIFKGGTPNTIGALFDYSQFQIGELVAADVLVIGFKNSLGSYSFSQYFYSSSLNRWTRNAFGTPDATNTILTEDAIIRINLRNTYKEISIPSGPIIQKLDSGKLNIN